MKSLNPIFLAITILVLSLISTAAIFKSTMTSWIAFVTILTFSSGMMTLFMYTASMSSNEKSKQSKSIMMGAVLLIVLMMPSMSEKGYAKTMKTFSSMSTILVMGMVLILTLAALSIHGHHPNQTISSSF